MISPYDLNLRHVLALPVLARIGSVTAAAPEVNLSQSALTQGLARLEAALGAALFDRAPQGVSPSPAGRLFVARAATAAAHLSNGAGALRAAGGAGLERRLSMSQLRALVAVGAHGSFTVAAQASGLAQPSLHRAARELEAAIGQPLFQRTGRTIGLTAAGGRLAKQVRLALAELRAGLQEIEALSVRGAGRVVVGALPLARAVLLPRAIARFAQLFPAGQVRVIDGRYGELLSDLRAGDIDLIVGAARDPAPAADVIQEPLFDDRLIVVARRGHPLAAQPSPTLAELAGFPWVMSRPEAPLRARWEALFHEAGLTPPEPRAECSSTMAIRGLLLEGDWLSLLSPDQVAVEQRAGLIVQIGAVGGGLRRIAMTRRRDLRPTPAQAAMAELIRQLTRTDPAS